MVTRIQGEKVESLFAGWDETLIWSCLQGVMGSLYGNSQEDPDAAAACLGDFAFFAGNPDRELLEWICGEINAPKLLVPGSSAWSALMESTFGNRLLKTRRYRILKGGEHFDVEALEANVRRLPEEMEIVPIGKDLYEELKIESWSADFVAQFNTYEEFEELGLGFVVLLDRVPVSGASSYSRYREGIEIEVDTRDDYRRRGLAAASASRLILECLERGLYPSWDAASEISARFAEKLGYVRGEPYDCYFMQKPEETVLREPGISELRFLIADIDGTLVNTARNMLPRTVRVLRDLHRRGVLIGIASGRPVGAALLKEIREGWGLGFDVDCVIGMNGGQILDRLDGTEESVFPLEPETIRRGLELLDASGIPGNPFVYRGENMIARKYDDLMRLSCERHHVSCRIVEDDSEFCEEPTAKLLFRLDRQKDMQELERYLRKHPKDSLAFFKTQPNLMEMQDPRVNKGRAMEVFCRRHGIPLDETMAFGDTTNDNEMLLTAGWSVCLVQGSADSLNSADAVTELDNEHDGFGDYLLKHWYTPRGWKLDEI